MRRAIAMTVALSMSAVSVPALAGGGNLHSTVTDTKPTAESIRQPGSLGTWQRGDADARGMNALEPTAHARDVEAAVLTPTTMGTQEIIGTVVKTEKDRLYIDHMGAVVPLSVTAKTRFEGSAKKVSDLQVGTQIRIAFSIQKQVENVALKLSPSSALQPETGMGGSGFDESQKTPSKTKPLHKDPAQDPREVLPGDRTFDNDLSNPSTVPDIGESRGPASPMPTNNP